jgi:EAL domain-containing protein (putative c-di-GMP-specific phosphodiesterase class I)
MHSADVAMYRVKERGKNSWRVFSDELVEAPSDRMEMASELRHGIANGELYVVFQPQIDIVTHKVVGVEALARWRSPRLGQVPPSQFIPVAESAGLICTLGEFFLDEACRHARRWADNGAPLTHVAVNVSVAELRHPDTAARVAKVLAKSGMNPRYLELEITESILMDNDGQTQQTLRALEGLGVRLTVDDFGVGYSSLRYLQRLPVDRVKMDRSFIQNVPESRNDARLAAAIIALARSLGIELVAEGVETERQLSFLRSHRCRIIQGYLLSPPVPADAIPALLMSDWPSASATARGVTPA